MNTPSLQRRWRWLVFAAVLLVFPSLALAVVKDGDKSKIHPQPFSDSRHIPGRLIVKYKDTLTQCAHCLLRQGRSFQSALSDGSPSLDTLHRRFGVQSATPLFRRESSIQASSMVTLSQLRMTEQQELAAIKVKFPARTKRIPTGATSPNVYHVYLLQLPRSANIEQAAAEFSKDPHVAYAHPDYQVKTFWTPNDPYYASSNSWGQGYQDLWGLHRINASRAWDYSMGTGIKVAVIDTGVDYNHADLAANIWVNPCEDLNRNNRVDASDFNGRDDACTGESPNGYIDDVRGWDFATDPDDNNPMDVNGHGTHLSGTIAALGNNARGIVGVAPQAKIMAVKGLDDSGNGDVSALVEAIDYATDNGADVLSNSWGTNADIQAINDAFRRAHSAGCVVIAAAGNSNSPVESVSPANIPEVIAVGASDHLDAKADFSNWGWKLDVLAPGGDSANFSDPNHTYINILSLRANGTDMYGGGGQIVGTNYYRARGTSMAAPHVSGVAALMLAHRPQLTNEDIRTLLRASADDIGATGRELTTGFGRVNALRALQTPLTPFLYLQSSQISDAPSVGGNGDGFINPGETVSLRLTIKNGGLNTTGGTATLTSKQAWMSVLPATVSFGPVNRSSVQIVAFQLRISPSAPAFGRVALQLQLTAQGMSNRFEQLADLGEIFPNVSSLPSQPGWPITLTATDMFLNPSELLVANLDGVGSPEVAVVAAYGGAGQMWVFSKDGRLTLGWPKRFVSWDGFHPLAADLDGNGDREIFVGPNYKFEHNGSSQSWGTIPTGCQQAPQISSLADVNQDGAVEVIGFLTNCPSGNVFIWDSRGRLLPNMPIQAPLLAPNARALIFPPALGDLDGDGDLELITVGGNAYEPGSQAHVYAWHHTGVMVSGWPKDLGYGSLATIGSPTAGDIDGDGRDEIVHVTELIGQWKIDVWRGNGNSATGWPITFVPQGTDSYFLWSPVLGDLDGDGTLEVLAVENQQRDAVYNTRIHAFHGMTGRPVAGWPKDVPDFFAPIFVNFNPSYYYERVHHPILVNLIGDGRPETLMALRRYLPATNRYLDAVFAWQADGSLVGSFPFYLPQDTFRTTNVYGVDLDQDGDQEIGLIRQDETFQKMQVFFWNVPNAVRSDTHPWPMYKHDVRRTNRHVRPVDLVVTRVSGPITGIIGNGATLTATVRNTKTTIAGAFQVGLYLSSDTSITSGDIRLATILVPPLAGGTSKTLSATVTVPSRLMTGAYYWGAIVDSNDDVPETSEANNTLSGNRTKWTKLDLMTMSVTGMPTPNSGTNPDIYPPPPPTYTISTTIRNSGQEASWACQIGIYLSTDATITPSDILVGTYPLAAGLAAGYNTTTTKAFPLPTSLAPGTYYWGAIVDYNNALQEISETNNAKAGNTVTIKSSGTPPPATY